MTPRKEHSTIPCAAYGCAEAIQVPGGPSPYCAPHQGLVWSFDRWLDGVYRSGRPPTRSTSFDVARAGWQRAAAGDDRLGV